MPEAVVVGGLVQCPHGGTAKLQSGSDKLKVAGASAVTAGDETGTAFGPPPPTPSTPAPCSWSNPANGAPSPCLTTAAASKGVSSKLTVSGKGVLLSTASGSTSNPTDPSALLWTINSAGQTKLTVSS